MTEFLTEDNKKTIALAYDNLKREDFLNRLNKYIEDTVQLVLSSEQLARSKEIVSYNLYDGMKTKPGKMARPSENQKS